MPIEKAELDYGTIFSAASFLDSSAFQFFDAEVEVVKRLAILLNIEVLCAFNCPMTGIDRSESYFAVAATSRGETTCAIHEGREHLCGVNSFDVTFDGLDDGRLLNPRIIVSPTIELSDQEKKIAEILLRQLIELNLRVQFARLRRLIINARIHSEDIGSFLHKALQSGLCTLLGAESASFFVVDSNKRLLKLRGTTGLASGAAKESIYFHVDEPRFVTEVHNENVPLLHFDSGKPVETARGKSVERVKEFQFVKAYWPLKLATRSAISANPRIPLPCVGVMRMVNTLGSKATARAPFTWIQQRAMSYCAESLYNVISAFISTEEASFKRNEAFHGAISLVDAVAKNLDILYSEIFDDYQPSTTSKSPRFKIEPRDLNNPSAYNTMLQDIESLRLLLKTSRASVKSLGYQIERAEIVDRVSDNEFTHRLITDVILRALDRIDDMRMAHSVDEPAILPSAHQLLNLGHRPPPVRGSPSELTGIFLNLCENSVKYRKIGEPIRVDIKIEPGSRFVRIVFRDYGIGIKEGEEERIFARGYRTPDAREHIVRGNGVGLSWCRETMELLGGRITARHRVDGLEIELMLPRMDGD